MSLLKLMMILLTAGGPHEVAPEEKSRIIAEAQQICKKALKDLDRRSKLYQICIFGLVAVMWYLSGIQGSYYLAPVAWIACFLVCIYFAFMSMIGHRMERHAIIAGCLSLSLRSSMCGFLPCDGQAPAFDLPCDEIDSGKLA
jgi:hypothetical protein